MVDYKVHMGRKAHMGRKVHKSHKVHSKVHTAHMVQMDHKQVHTVRMAYMDIQAHISIQAAMTDNNRTLLEVVLAQLAALVGTPSSGIFPWAHKLSAGNKPLLGPEYIYSGI
jgi:hypothetical protein